MRKLLPLVASGVLLTVLSFGCEAKNPVGPGTVSITELTTTTTTTSVMPGRRYVAFQAPLNVPSDMTLFFQLLSSGSSLGGVLGLAQNHESYSVVGVYRMDNGTAGAVKGQLTGLPDSGQFTGTLTAEVSGCTAEREYSGPVNGQLLQWRGGATLRDCPGSPLAFPEFTLLRSDAPPPTTTMEPTTTVVPTTTTVVGALRTEDFTVSPSGTGLMAATVYSFRYDEPPVGGLPPFTYSWNFGDGSAPAVGTATTHVFNNTGNFVVAGTVKDSTGLTAVDQAPVQVRSATGVWTVTIATKDGNFVLQPDGFRHALVLNQTQTQVIATVSDPLLEQVRAGMGNVSNPRALSVIGLELKPAGGSGSAVTISYIGNLNETLAEWSGTATGLADCPCPFTAIR